MSTTLVQPTSDLRKTHSRVIDYTPAVDIYENENEILLVADTPGTTKDQVSVDVEQDHLTLVAHASTPDGTKLEYRRLFRIGAAVDLKAAVATLKNGVLTINLPKAEAYRPRKITVSAA